MNVKGFNGCASTLGAGGKSQAIPRLMMKKRNKILVPAEGTSAVFPLNI